MMHLPVVAVEDSMALRSTVREIVRMRGYTPESLIAILDELADEYRARGEQDHLAAVVEVLDLFEGNASPQAIRSYFG